MTKAIPSAETGIDFGQSGVSRYIQLASLFRRRIETGHWSVGQQIPTVDELAAECAVARATVRQALDSLEDEGLIARFRAKGTFVTRQPQQDIWYNVPTNWHGLLFAPEGITIEVLATAKNRQPGNLQHDLGELAHSYGYWRRLHSREGVPYYLGEVYIDARVCKRIPARALQTKTSMRILGDVKGLEIVDARQTLTLGAADPETARLLKIPINAPVAHVHRSAIDQRGNLVFVGDGVYRGDIVRLETKLK